MHSGHHSGPLSAPRVVTMLNTTAIARRSPSKPMNANDVPSVHLTPTAPVVSLASLDAEVKARIRILVVDDEQTARESCATILRYEGYDVTVCQRGQEAIGQLSRRR